MFSFPSDIQETQRRYDLLVSKENATTQETREVSDAYFYFCLSALGMIASITTEEEFRNAYELIIEAKRFDKPLEENWQTLLSLLAVVATRSCTDLPVLRTISEAFPKSTHMQKILLDEYIEELGQKPLV